MSVLHKGKLVHRYGLSCGYWSNRTTDIDRHAMAHVMAGLADGLFDVFDEDYAGQRLHQCIEELS